MPTKTKPSLARALRAKANRARAIKDSTMVREGAAPAGEELTVSVSTLRASMSEYINAVHYLHRRVLLMKNGKLAVAMVPPEDLELLRRIEDAIDLDAARAALKEPGAVPWEKVKAKLGF